MKKTCLSHGIGSLMVMKPTTLEEGRMTKEDEGVEPLTEREIERREKWSAMHYHHEPTNPATAADEIRAAYELEVLQQTVFRVRTKAEARRAAIKFAYDAVLAARVANTSRTVAPDSTRSAA
jgi:hypothetical protein